MNYRGRNPRIVLFGTNCEKYKWNILFVIIHNLWSNWNSIHTISVNFIVFLGSHGQGRGGYGYLSGRSIYPSCWMKMYVISIDIFSVCSVRRKMQLNSFHLVRVLNK